MVFSHLRRANNDKIMSDINELQVELSTNTKLILDLRAQINGVSRRQAEGMAELHNKVDSIVRDDMIHDAHHEWVEAQLEIAQERAAFWREIRKKLAVTGILGAVGLVFAVIGYAISQYVKNGGSQ